MLSTKKQIDSLKYILTLATTVSLFSPTLVKAAIDINFDYTYDTNSFFNPGTTEGSDRRNTLELAGQYFTDYLNDDLLAIERGTGSADIGGNGGSNTWTALFSNPGDGSSQTITDLEIAADTITIFAGGRSLGSSTLGIGGTGGIAGGSGSQDFINLIQARGEAGALDDPQTDIGLWGGSITFDNDDVFETQDVGGNPVSNPYSWHNTADAAGLDAGEADFLSIALHELAHVLGYGGITTSSWNTLVDNTDPDNPNFEGSNSLAVYQSEVDNAATSVPLAAGSTSHWEAGITSFTLDGTSQEANLAPVINIGERKLLTNLDYAGLEDIGWEVDTATTAAVPFEFSPGFGLLLIGGSWGLYARSKARRYLSSDKQKLN